MTATIFIRDFQTVVSELSDNLVLLLCSIAPWRLELFFKLTAELKSKVLPFIKEHGISRINITNKVLPSLEFILSTLNDFEKSSSKFSAS